MSTLYFYNCTLDRIIDGDTLDCSIDLGFNVILAKQRIRLKGINAPESRTRDLEEKKRGLAAKARLTELCGEKFQLTSFGKGKYGRILGIPHTVDGKSICDILVEENHATPYDGGSRG